MRYIWLVVAIALLWGCGGGGGGITAGSTVQPTTVQIRISTQAAAPATVLYAVDFTLQLPNGVTVAADSTSGEVDQGVLQPSDSAALAGGRYQGAVAGAPATVKVNVIDPGGFAVGPLATLSCQLAPGTAIDASSFPVAAFSARDAGGVRLPEVTHSITVLAQ